MSKHDELRIYLSTNRHRFGSYYYPSNVDYDKLASIVEEFFSDQAAQAAFGAESSYCAEDSVVAPREEDRGQAAD
jgi:hypothetical protein